ncbi:MAG: InlB B-repeat-containing protein [Candidatus Bathyarchaeota archaeon]|nr:InlB B-repeat-containing protein [Candidatus Termiticorpusculum sp.]
MKSTTRLVAILLEVMLILTIFPVVPLVMGQDSAVDQLVYRINAISGLTAVVDAVDSNVVTVSGWVFDVRSTLVLDIGLGITVNWGANYHGQANPLIRFTGGGTFQIGPDGWIENVGSGVAINAEGAKVVVTGDSPAKCGVVQANSGAAIVGSGPRTIVMVEGYGSVFGDETSNLQPVINMNNPSNTGDNVFIKDNGSVWVLSENLYGYTIQTYGNVIVDGGDVYSRSVYGRAINLVGSNSVARVNGGKVHVDGVNGVAISTATTDPSAVTNTAVVVTGGIVSATSGYAIRTTGASSYIEVSGGAVLATTGNAIRSERLINVEISGGFVFAYGRAITGATNVIHIVGGGIPNIHSDGIVVAWNKPDDNLPIEYDEGLDTHLLVSTGGSATWHNTSPEHNNDGIRYVNSENSGFLPIKDVIVTSNFEYNIQYELNDGSHPETPASYTVNDLPLAIAAPLKTDYTFLGWVVVCDNGTIVPELFFDIPKGTTGDLVLIAQWTNAEPEFPIYDIIYELNGGTNDNSNPSTYTSSGSDPQIEINAPTRGDDVFLGWTVMYVTDSELLVNITTPIVSYIIPKDATGVITLIAHWAFPSYNIFYKWDDEFVMGYPDSYNVADLPLTIDVPDRGPGYTFWGWAMVRWDVYAGYVLDFTGPFPYTIPEGTAGDITLIAIWGYDAEVPSQHSIEYNLQEGVDPGNPSLYTVNDLPLKIDDPTRDGYTFFGWIMWYNRTQSIYQKFSFISPSFVLPEDMGDIELWAIWVPVSYSISYVLNGGVNAAGNPLGYSIASDFSVDVADPEMMGYTFLGWTVRYANGSGVTVPVRSFSVSKGTFGDIVLTAHWGLSDVGGIVSYTVTYDGVGFTDGFVPSNHMYVSGSKVLVPNQGSMVKEGYTFIGWALSSSAEFPSHLPGSTFTILSDTALFAVWEKNVEPLEPEQYTVRYLRGTHGVFDEKVVGGLSFGAVTPAAPAEVIGEVGWEFIGWSPELSSIVEGDVTYVAQWKQITFTVLFRDWNNAILKTEAVVYGAAATAPANPTRTGYTFTGWNPSAFNNVISDLTVTAQYTQSNDSNNNNSGGSSSSSSSKPSVNNRPSPAPLVPVLPDDEGADNSPPREVVVDPLPLVWALMNLVLSVSGLVLAVLAGIYVLLKYRQQRGLASGAELKRRLQSYGALWLVVAFILGVMGLFVFLFTPGALSGVMVLVNGWTILYVTLFVAEVVVIFYGLRFQILKE